MAPNALTANLMVPNALNSSFRSLSAPGVLCMGNGKCVQEASEHLLFTYYCQGDYITENVFG